MSCAYAWQRHCSLLAWGVPGEGFAVRGEGRRTAKSRPLSCGAEGRRTTKSWALPCGAEGRRTAKIRSLPCSGEGGARQCFLARQIGAAHGNESRTAERNSSRQRTGRTATALPCVFGEAHGKEPFAGPDVAVRPLPCADAWQRRCRANYALCRAFCLHGNVLFSRCEAL